MILDLLKGIDDPEDRIRIAAAINMLRDMYANGSIGYDELKRELTDIVASIYTWRHPELTYSEILEKSKSTVEEIAKAIVISTLSTRVRSTFKMKL